MSINHFIVSQNGSHWQASFKGTTLGPFDSEQMAVKAAIIEAGKHTPLGPIEILVQDDNRETRSVWTSERAD
jgi:hypothetical protein